jgi:hypothetical protein
LRGGLGLGFVASSIICDPSFAVVNRERARVCVAAVCTSVAARPNARQLHESVVRSRPQAVHRFQDAAPVH